MNKPTTIIPVIIIVNACVWGLAMIMSARALSGTGAYQQIQNVLAGCAADVKPDSQGIDLEAAYQWLEDESDALGINEAVFYPLKGFIHVGVKDPDNPSPKRILMRI